MASETLSIGATNIFLLGDDGAAEAGSGEYHFLQDGYKYLSLQFYLASAQDADITIQIWCCNHSTGLAKQKPWLETTVKGSDGTSNAFCYDFETCASGIKAVVSAYQSGGAGSQVIMNIS